MTFSIAMRTCTRVVNYGKDTLMRLVETGTLLHPGVVGLHISHGDGLTPNQNACRAIYMAAADCADWIIFLEDDVDFIDDFMGSVERWIADFATPSVRAYPLGCFYVVTESQNVRVGAWTTYGLDHFYGSQAVLMRTEDAVTYAHWLTGLGLVGDRDCGFDRHLAEWHREVEPEQNSLITPAPGFIDHTGEFSALGPPGSWERVGKMQSFAGRDWSYTAASDR